MVHLVCTDPSEPKSLDALRRLDRLNDEVTELRDRIEQIRPHQTSHNVDPTRHRTEPPYAPHPDETPE